MINKIVADAAAAMRDVRDGATVMVGGFGAVGQPNHLIEALLCHGSRDLTVIANNAGFDAQIGLPLLFAAGRVRKLICSFPRTVRIFDELYAAGKIEVEVVPQGTLAERIRAAGAGIPAFYTPTGARTLLTQTKPHKVWDGRDCVLETALHADVALVEAWAADRWGNLVYRGGGQNFNVPMATAAKITIAQVHRTVELGTFEPDQVVTPSVYVNRVVLLPEAERMLERAA